MDRDRLTRSASCASSSTTARSPRSSSRRSATTTTAGRAATATTTTRCWSRPPASCAAYFDRDLKEFDLPLAPIGTDFQQRVWAELREVGYGETASYGEIAHRLGLTNAASRAVGLANGRNPIPIVIPCHRVIGANGTLTGYAGGLERKQTLLELEQDALF